MTKFIKSHLLCLSIFFFLFGSHAHAVEKSDVWATSYALEANGQYEKAAALLVPMLDNGQSSEFALIRYGWLHYLQGNYSDAIRSYKRALKRNQRSFDARLGITLPLLAQQRWKEATRYLNQVLDQSPYDYTAHIRLMLCEEGQRKWAALEQHAKRLAAFYPTDATILVYLARAYAWQDNNITAKKAYQRVIVRVPDHVEASRFLSQ
ncbi:MAG: tetratricopeptide repeat protein [Mariprofundaceae bacterium]